VVRKEEVRVDGGRSRGRNVTQGKELKGSVTFLKRSKGNET